MDADAVLISLRAFGRNFGPPESHVRPVLAGFDDFVLLQKFQDPVQIRFPPELFQLVFGKMVRFFIAAEPPDKTLGDDNVHGGGDQKRLHVHVQKPGQRPRRGVGMQSGEHQMPRQGGVYSQRSGFVVADFPDHDDVRVLPDERAQSIGKSEVDVGLDLRLVDAGNPVFNRIFNRGDVYLRRVQNVQNRI